MRQIAAIILSLCFLSCGAFAAQQDATPLTVRIDVSVSRAVLDDVCSDQAIDETAIRNSGAVRDMLAHFAKFREDFTMDAYLDARRAAAACETLDRDIFRFAQVIEKRVEIAAFLDHLDSEDAVAGATARATAMVAGMTPDGVDYDGRAIVMVGTPSCGGWSKASTFYVDAPCLLGDPDGLVFLVAHEIYHGVQDIFMPMIADDAAGSLRLMNEIVREGTALFLADFTKIDMPGDYAAFNQRVARRNDRRRRENFDLLDVSFSYLAASSDDAAFDKVYGIGASGVFDSPFYAVGALMTQTIDAALGREALLAAMASGPAAFFRAYETARQTDPEAPALPKSVLKAAAR